MPAKINAPINIQRLVHAHMILMAYNTAAVYVISVPSDSVAINYGMIIGGYNIWCTIYGL